MGVVTVGGTLLPPTGLGETSRGGRSADHRLSGEGDLERDANRRSSPKREHQGASIDAGVGTGGSAVREMMTSPTRREVPPPTQRDCQFEENGAFEVNPSRFRVWNWPSEGNRARSRPCA